MSTEIIKQKIDGLSPVLSKLLDTPERVARFKALAKRLSPALQKCDVVSVQLAFLDLAVLDLDPTPIVREAYIVPFYNDRDKKTIATPIIGPAGWVKLIGRAGFTVTAEVVYESEYVRGETIVLGTTTAINHYPDPRPTGNIVFAYAIAKRPGYADIVAVCTADDLRKAQATSKAGDFGPWQKWQAQMARKTVLKKCAKLVPGIIGDSQLTKAIAIDDFQGGFAAQPRYISDDYGQDVAEYLEADEVQPAPPPQDVNESALNSALDRLETPGLTMAGVEAVWKENPALQNDPTFKAAVVAAKDRAKAL